MEFINKQDRIQSYQLNNIQICVKHSKRDSRTKKTAIYSLQVENSLEFKFHTTLFSL